MMKLRKEDNFTVDKQAFVFEDQLFKLAPHEEEIIYIRGKAFLVRPADQADVERLAKGNFCID